MKSSAAFKKLKHTITYRPGEVPGMNRGEGLNNPTVKKYKELCPVNQKHLIEILNTYI